MECSTISCSIKYSHLVWSVLILLMALSIIDRFTVNIWPIYFKRQIDFVHDDWSQIAFLSIGFFSGRMLIVSSTFIWLLQCRCFFNFLFEHKPKWLIIHDILHENNAIHYVLGYLCVAIPMIIHPWIVFVPIFQNYHLRILTSWWRPIDPNTNFYLENVHNHEICVSINDLYALCISTFVFLVLFPLSIYHKFRRKHWMIAHYIHLLAALLYAIELLRTPFTIHCIYLSTPFIFMFVFDRIYGIYKYRKSSNITIVGRYEFDSDYILLLLHIPNIYRTITYREIGDIIYLNTKQLRCTLSHPFTSFYNHNNSLNMVQLTKSLRTSLGDESHKFPVLTYGNKASVAHLELDPEETYQFHRNESQSATIERWKYKMAKLRDAKKIEATDSMEQKHDIDSMQQKHQRLPVDDVEEDDIEWNVGFIIKVHQRFTKYLQEMNVSDENNCIITYGPYRSSFANIVSELIDYKSAEDTDFGVSSIVLIATGAGVTFIIDFVLYLRDKFESDKHYALSNEIRIHFSCRSIRLFQFVTDFLTEKKYENLFIYAHLTSHKNVYDYDMNGHRNKNDVDMNEMEAIKRHKKKRNHAKIGRASFQNVLYNSPKHSKVFFCGSQEIQSRIKVLCKQLGFQFYEGHTF